MKAASVTPVDLLAHSAAVRGRVFASVEDPDGAIRVVTYAEELERVRRTAAVLVNLGVRAGDRVHVHLDNCLDYYDLWFATGLVGAAIVPTNPLAARTELSHFLDDSAPVVSFTSSRLVAAVRSAFHSDASLDVVAVDDPGPQGLSARTAHVSVPAGLGNRRSSSESVAAVLYTSGTTSRAKGVLVTHDNYMSVGRAVARHLGVTAEDRWLVVLPLFHANAQYYCTMSALVAGASIAVMPRFSASGWGGQAARHGATLASLFAAPIRMILLAPRQPNDAENRLRAVLFAQNVTDPQAADFEERFATRLLQLYGMTETVLPPTFNPASPARRWRSIGCALPDVEIRLETEDGQPAPTGTVGELLVGGTPGHTLALGYLHQPAATAELLAGGWLRTGDLAWVDADGFYYFVDRAKDMIKRSGENISASEIEDIVCGHPAIVECAAVGVPDEIRDEAIVAYVVIRQGVTTNAEELTAWCRQRMAKFKVPSHFVFVHALPRTSVGKIQKGELRKSVDRVNVDRSKPSI